jgi:hypothetical protein
MALQSRYEKNLGFAADAAAGCGISIGNGTDQPTHRLWLPMVWRFHTGTRSFLIK